jgi:hypothetical protein
MRWPQACIVKRFLTSVKFSEGKLLSVPSWFQVHPATFPEKSFESMIRELAPGLGGPIQTGRADEFSIGRRMPRKIFAKHFTSHG